MDYSIHELFQKGFMVGHYQRTHKHGIGALNLNVYFSSKSLWEYLERLNCKRKNVCGYL